MTPPTDGPGTAPVVALVVLGLLVAVAAYAWFAAAFASVLRKLGRDPWRAWVPVLNLAEVLERGGVPGWQVILLMVPVVDVYGYLLYVQAVHRIGRQFGRGAGTTVLGALLPPVWASVLGWSSALPVPAEASVTSRRDDVWGTAGPAVVEASAGIAHDRYETPAGPALTGAYAPPLAAPAPPAPTPARAPLAAPAVSPWAPLPEAAAPAAALAPVPAQVSAPAPAVGPPPVPPAPPALSDVVPTTAAPAAPAPVLPVPLPLPAAAPVASAASAPEPAPIPRPAPGPAAEAAAVPEPAPVPAPDHAVAPVPVRAVEPAPELAHAVPGPVPVPASPPAPPDLPPAVHAAFPQDEDDDEIDGTVMVQRDVPVPWTLVLDDGTELPLPGASVLLGRRPTQTDPSVHVLALADPSRTVSKVHARLDLLDGGWLVTDLASTNGVHLVSPDGTEQRLTPHVATPVTGGLVLGKLGVRLVAPGEAP